MSISLRQSLRNSIFRGLREAEPEAIAAAVAAGTFDLDVDAYLTAAGIGAGASTPVEGIDFAGNTTTLFPGSVAGIWRFRPDVDTYHLYVTSDTAKSIVILGGADAGENIKQVRIGNWGTTDVPTGGPIGMALNLTGTSVADYSCYVAYREVFAGNNIRVIKVVNGAYAGGEAIDTPATGDAILEYQVDTNKLRVRNGDNSLAQEITPASPLVGGLKALVNRGSGGGSSFHNIAGNRMRTSGPSA